MNNLLAPALGTLPVLVVNSALAQGDSVMNRGMMDGAGYGGLWLPALLIAVAIALVALAIRRYRK